MLNSIHRRSRPAEQTVAEEFYYVKQMAAQTPMVVMLNSGEAVQGMIAWYDKRCIKLNRFDTPNLLIMKTAIRYMHKGQSGVPTNGLQVRR